MNTLDYFSHNFSLSKYVFLLSSTAYLVHINNIQANAVKYVFIK